jgi:hypothetical protein
MPFTFQEISFIVLKKQRRIRMARFQTKEKRPGFYTGASLDFGVRITALV